MASSVRSSTVSQASQRTERRWLNSVTKPTSFAGVSAPIPGSLGMLVPISEVISTSSRRRAVTRPVEIEREARVTVHLEGNDSRSSRSGREALTTGSARHSHHSRTAESQTERSTLANTSQSARSQLDPSRKKSVRREPLPCPIPSLDVAPIRPRARENDLDKSEACKIPHSLEDTEELSGQSFSSVPIENSQRARNHSEKSKTRLLEDPSSVAPPAASRRHSFADSSETKSPITSMIVRTSRDHKERSREHSGVSRSKEEPKIKVISRSRTKVTQALDLPIRHSSKSSKVSKASACESKKLDSVCPHCKHDISHPDPVPSSLKEWEIEGGQI